MILCTLIFLISIVDMSKQFVTCNDDVHCSVGFFCHTMTHTCHECLSCDHLGRYPGPSEYHCIKSDQQCGPCLNGLINDEANWGDMCLSPEGKNIKMLTSSIYMLVSCVATGVLISLFIVYSIWNTHIININIACKKVSSHTMDLDEVFTKNNPMALTA